MVSQKDALVIDKAKVPVGKVVGTYTFLRDMGKTLEKNEAIKITAPSQPDAKKIQTRWRAYFKGAAHSRKEALPEGKVLVYLWLES